MQCSPSPGSSPGPGAAASLASRARLVDRPGQIWALVYHSFHDIQRVSELFATNATKVIEDLNAASRYSHVFINRAMPLMVLDRNEKPPAMGID